MSRIGIFGGSFNPIHHGHIALAKAILEQCGLDEVWLMVSPQNPLKRDHQLLADHLRLELAQRALLDEKHIKVSDYEFHLPKPSYTWNTLQHLKHDFPEHTFLLIIGGDNWERFPLWYKSRDIVRDYQIVIYPRKGSDIEIKKLPANVSIVDTPLLDVSSTEIRNRLRRHESIAKLVPNAIISLVERYYAELADAHI